VTSVNPEVATDRRNGDRPAIPEASNLKLFLPEGGTIEPSGLHHHPR
jgi:hypothetical protein